MVFVKGSEKGDKATLGPVTQGTSNLQVQWELDPHFSWEESMSLTLLFLMAWEHLLT